MEGLQAARGHRKRRSGMALRGLGAGFPGSCRPLQTSISKCHSSSLTFPIFALIAHVAFFWSLSICALTAFWHSSRRTALTFASTLCGPESSQTQFRKFPEMPWRGVSNLRPPFPRIPQLGVACKQRRPQEALMPGAVLAALPARASLELRKAHLQVLAKQPSGNRSGVWHAD